MYAQLVASTVTSSRALLDNSHGIAESTLKGSGAGLGCIPTPWNAPCPLLTIQVCGQYNKGSDCRWGLCCVQNGRHIYKARFLSTAQDLSALDYVRLGLHSFQT